MLRISASNVAAAIGEHKYKSKDAAIFQMIEHNFQWKSMIDHLKNDHNLKTVDDLTMEAIQANPGLVNVIQSHVDTALQNSESIVQVVADCQKEFETMVQGPHKDLVASALAQTIQTERGTLNEKNVLDLYEHETGSVVTERNTVTKKKLFKKDNDSTCSFTLVGIVDGLANNRIIDAKERKRKWTSVPSQDLIQLRAQMELQDLAEAELVERFPDGTRRNTVIQRDATEWKRIEEKLYETAKEIQDIVQEPSKLLSLIQKFTV